MKKISIFIMSLFMLTLGTVLSACSLKPVQASFKQEEHAVSLNDEINLDEYLQVEGAQISDVTYLFSDSSIFELNGRQAKAKNYGKSYVYATYEGNKLASMLLIVKKQFVAPDSFSLSDDGVLSWNRPVSYYGTEKEIVEKFTVVGTGVVYSTTNPTQIVETIEINEENWVENSMPLKPGNYKIKVKSEGRGNFEDSEFSAEQELYVGYMSQAKDLVWDNAVLSWTQVPNARYRVSVDGIMLDQFQTETSKNLDSYFSNLNAGVHKVAVWVFDEVNGTKLAKQSQEIEIEKLADPQANYIFGSTTGGSVKISTNEKVEKYVVTLTSESGEEKVYEFANNGEDVVTDFDALDSQVYQVQIQAHSSGLTYKSKLVDFGKVYKLAPISVTGLGGDEENSVTNVKVQSSIVGKTNSYILIEGLDESVKTNGISANSNFVEVSIPVSNSGVYDLTLKQIPYHSTNMIDGESVYVLNSDSSQNVNITKLADFTDVESGSKILHSYVDGKSVLKFNSIENATSYQLFVNETGTFVEVDEVDSQEGVVTIELSAKIDDLFSTVEIDGKNCYQFKIVAKTGNDKFDIFSSEVKTIELLAAPGSLNSGDSTDKTYTWAAIENAGEYLMSIYTVDKTVYEQNKDTLGEVETSGLTCEIVPTNSASYTFENVGYYYVEIQSISTDENNFISSKQKMKDVFYIAEKLVVGQMAFGKNDDYVNHPEFSQSSGYFLKIQNAENVTEYEVKVGETTEGIYEISQNNDESIYLLAETFADATKTYNVSVIAHSQDGTIYQDSDASILEVKKLESVTYADLSIDSLTKEIKVAPKTGVSAIKIVGEKSSVHATDGTTAKFEISNLSNFTLQFTLEGSEETNGIYKDTNGVVYLNSDSSTYGFKRLARPTDLQYYNGDLTFNHTETSATSYYVLDINCALAAPGDSMKISIEFRNDGVFAKYGLMEIKLSGDDEVLSDYLTTSGNLVTIELTKIIEKVKASTMASFYNQATKLTFSTYAYVIKAETQSNVVYLSSLHAKVKNGEETDTECEIQKMNSPTVEFAYDSTNFTFTWDSVEVATDVAAQTTYEIYQDGNATPLQSATSYQVSASGFANSTYYSFYVKAANPYYLDSAQSNVIRVYKLRSLASISLTNDAYLSYELLTSEKDFVDKVEVVYDKDGEETPCEVLNGRVQIVGVGTYIFKLKGKVVEDSSNNMTTTYIDSATSSWTVENMETLKPASTTLTYNGEKLSWSAFAQNENLSTLKYIAVFKDGNGKTSTYVTTANEINFKEDENAFNAISALAAGNVTVSVSAYLAEYSAPASDVVATVPASGKVYYAPAVVLINGSEECNHFVYTDLTIKKYTTPQITSVQFLHTSLSDAQTPNIEIIFSGNYDDDTVFDVYINDTLVPTGDRAITETADGYKFTFNNSIFNNTILSGDAMLVEISARSSTNIPSSVGSVKIERNDKILKVEFVAQEGADAKFSQKLKIEVDENMAERLLGGIVLKLDCYVEGSDLKSEYLLVRVNESTTSVEYDLTSFIKQNMSDGGQIQISAFINNYSDNSNKVYYLACAEMTTLANSAKVLCSVTEENITRVSGGFKIDDSINASGTIYVVENGGSRFELTAGDGYYFEFPDNWLNGTYDFDIYAVCDGYVRSATQTISYELSRIDSISSVTMKRDTNDLSNVMLTWSPVANASNYIIKVSGKLEGEREFEYAFSGTGNKNSFTLLEIFGQYYNNLIQQGQISAMDLEDDVAVTFEIISVGSGNYNHSQSYKFNATIKGNKLTENEIGVDEEFGRLQFSSEIGQTYLYRFVNNTGNNLQEWKMITADSQTTYLDESEIGESVAFNVEIITIGSATDEDMTTTSAEYSFVMDSLAVTTYQRDKTFLLNEKVEKVGYVATDGLKGSLVFSLHANTFEKIYVGTTESSLENGEVASFVPAETGIQESTNVIYHTYDLIQLIDLLREQGISVNVSNGDLKLYFWAYRPTTRVDDTKVISKMTEFTFSFVEEADLKEITKIGEVASGSGFAFAEDYANSFALFNKEEVSGQEVLGVYIKVTKIGTVDVVNPFIKFISQEELSANEYFADEYCVNLTDIFDMAGEEYQEGEFKVELAILKVETITETETTYKFVMSDWRSAYTPTGETEEVELIFERLPQVQSLTLNNGMLYWTKNGNGATKYYVYFVEEDEENPETLGEKYYFLPTINEYFDASSWAGDVNKYFLAVQASNEDPFVVSSTKQFIVQIIDDVESPVLVYKNQVNSPVVLRDGKFVIDWTDGDFYKTLTQGSEETLSVQAESLATGIFTSPFTFTLKDLVEGNIKFRFKFTSNSAGSLGISKTFDVKAIDLLADLIAYGNDKGMDLANILTTLKTNAASSAVGDILDQFIKAIDKNTYGVSTFEITFDKYFEELQTGNYKLEYCLLGNNKTLSSTWYNFKNENGENVVYVNSQPTVKAIKVADTKDKALNSYRVLIQKSQIYTYTGGSYTTTQAENYVLSLSTTLNVYAFSIVKAGSSYSLQLISEDNDTSVSVYECDSQGNLVSGGDYLSFYLNLNNGDSILGAYGEDLMRLSYQMQIYAVGNNFSASSKSDLFELAFYSFGDNFAINNGAFTWTPHLNKQTTIIYKKADALTEVVATDMPENDGAREYARYSLDNLGFGLYDYIKFVTVGDVVGKSIYVDSDVYMISKVYKLNTPQLSSDLGYLIIDDANNKSMLAECYSDKELYNYMLYNNYSTSSSYIMFTDENQANEPIKYEVGVTGVNAENDDLLYKQTEEKARRFLVSSLGTTASIATEQDASKYYLRYIYCADSETKETNATLKTQGVAIKSAFVGIDAKMLDAVSDIKIEGGKLTWTAVEGRTEEDTTIAISESETAKIVYKIKIEQYENTLIDNGQTQTNVGEPVYFYTTNNEFDFTLINEDMFVKTESQTYLKTTIQTIALNISQEAPIDQQYVQLIEGGYAYGGLIYENSTAIALMSNGESLSEIDRVSPIEDASLRVVEEGMSGYQEAAYGHITWRYATSKRIDETNFNDYYSFVVTDSKERVIEGQISVKINASLSTEEENIFDIVFFENQGQIQEGSQVLKVYASQGPANSGLTIKSFARTIEITKMKTIHQSDYVIELNETGTTEILNLAKYFEDGNTNIVYATMKVDSTVTYFEFTKDRYKLYILNQVDDSISVMAPFVGKIVIGSSQKASIVFNVKYGESEINKNTLLYSDLSQEFHLQRLNWDGSSEIVWDEQTQKFSWDYNGYYTNSEEIDATQVNYIDVIYEDETVLYVDKELTQASEITLSAGTQINIVTIHEGVEGVDFPVAEIYHEEQTYYISADKYTAELGDLIDMTLPANQMFVILDESEGKSFVFVESGEQSGLYLIDSNKIVNPVFIIEAFYGNEPSVIKRIYQTTEMSFAPSIIGTVRLQIRVKLGSLNIQSDLLPYGTINESGEIELTPVEFNLFARGDGTVLNQYVIENEMQFNNIKHRMSKPAYLVNYTQGESTFAEEDIFYFTLANDIVLSEKGDYDSYLSGILFQGEFAGSLNGNGYSITYASSGVSALSTTVVVSEGNIKGSGSNDSSTTFAQGSALFEKLSEKSSVSNLNINVIFGKAETTTIANHTLLAGLAITNSGRLNNVNLTGFENNFKGYSSSKIPVMVYSGLVSINQGGKATITNCSAKCDMIVDDLNSTQYIYVSGIVYTNYAVIENCSVGIDDSLNRKVISVHCQMELDAVQVAGVAITNTTSGTIKNCTNNFDLSVSFELETNSTVYAAGIVCKGSGSLYTNTQNSQAQITFSDTIANKIYGDIYAKN